MLRRFGVLCILLGAAVYASETSDVVELTNENFKDTIKEGFWLIEFFAPWCGHCKKLAPTYEHLAKELKGKANIAKVDCTAQKQVCADAGVKGYPTIKLFENGEEKEKFAGPRTAGGFVSFLKEKAGLAADVTVAELPAQEQPKAAPQEKAAAEPEGPTDVVILTDANFEETTKSGFWFVKFYAPWCGHCKKMAPTWDHLATQLKGKANIAKIDCTAHATACSKHGVRGYPTLKLLKDGEEFKPYSGGRDADSFAKFLKEHSVIPADVTVTSLPNTAQPPPKKAAAPEEPEQPTDVVVLSDDDFAEKTKDGTWFIKFYAPWCGHCKRLAPAWSELGTKVNLVADSSVKVAKVDCTKSQSVCKNNGVRGYPTLKLFKNGSEAESYRGGRDLESLTAFVSQHGFAVKAGDATEEPQKIVHEDL